MRKALIGLMAAATVLTPLAPAAAQNWGGRDSARADRQQQRVERRAERQVQRAERQAQGANRQMQSADRQAQRADRQVQRAGWQAQRVDRGNDGAAMRAQRSANDAGWQQRAERQTTRDAAPNRVEVAQRSGQWDGRRDGSGQWSGRSRDGNSQWSGRSRDGNSQWSGRSRDGNWDRNRSRSGNWDRNWRNDNRYDWQRYRYAHRSIYRPGRYYSPYRGHSYTRFSIGFGLDPLFYSSRYWISDPWQYRLPPAYPGTQWVRYYDDVLLVDVYSGEVVDVIYDFFW
jgi:hypothetical protein